MYCSCVSESTNLKVLSMTRLYETRPTIIFSFQEFAPPGEWMHLDMAGVMGPTDNTPYLHKGMTGRPVRMLIQFLTQLALNKSM